MTYKQKNQKERIDLYETCTNQILEQIDQGFIPWVKPWALYGAAVSHVTGKSYSLLNQMLLGGLGGEFATFKQIQKEGGKVKKGAKSRRIVFWRMIIKQNAKEEDNNDSLPLLRISEEDGKKLVLIPVLAYYNVFNIEDAEGITRKYDAAKLPDEVESDDKAEAIIAAYIQRANLRLYRDDMSDRAFYRPSADTVTTPNRRQYQERGEYYSTLFHELVHSTGHKSRLDRKFNSGRKGDQDYAREELVAEIGAFFLCAYCGINTESTVKNSVAYLQSWRRHLENDKKLIVVAASRAQKAVEFILNKKLEDETNEENAESV